MNGLSAQEQSRVKKTKSNEKCFSKKKSVTPWKDWESNQENFLFHLY